MSVDEAPQWSEIMESVAEGTHRASGRNRRR